MKRCTCCAQTRTALRRATRALATRELQLVNASREIKRLKERGR